MTSLAYQATPEQTPVIVFDQKKTGTVTAAQSDVVQLLTYTVDSTMPTDGIAYMTTSTTPMYAGTYNTDSTWLDKDWNPIPSSEFPYPTWKVQEKEEKTSVPYNKELPYPQGKTS